jgi:hypothetical protein
MSIPKMPLRCLIVLQVMAWLASGAYAQYTISSPELVSKSTSGVQGDAESSEPVPSPNSDIIAFRSFAGNLVSGDTNQTADVFVRLKSGSSYVTERVSLDSNGEQSTEDCEEPSISQSESIDAKTRRGIYGVAFTSRAQLQEGPDYGGGVAPGGGSVSKQVYLRIPKLQQTLLISACPFGSNVIAGDGDSTHPSVVAVEGGRAFIVAFTSTAANLRNCGGTPQAPNAESRVFIAVIDVDLLEKGQPGYLKIGEVAEGKSGNFTEPALSGDGKSVVFTTDSTDLGFAYSPSKQIVVARKDKGGGEIFTLVSINSDFGGFFGASDKPSISFAGNIVAFRTFATQIPGHASVPYPALLIRYLDETVPGKAYKIANSDASGNPGAGGSCAGPQDSGCRASVEVNPNGKLAVVVDNSTNLVDGLAGGAFKVFFKELQTNFITRVDGERGGQNFQARIGGGSFNANTSYVSFTSVTGVDPDVSDVFRTTITDNPDPVVDGKPIEAPPDITVSPRRMDIVLEKFKGFTTSTSIGSVSSSATKIVYDVRVHRSGTKKGQRLTTTRNTLTLRDLTPGKYTVRYRAKAVANGKTKATSGYSPTATVIVKKK